MCSYSARDHLLKTGVATWEGGPNDENAVASKLTFLSLRLLSSVIQRFNLQSMLDVPCRDVNWQFGSWEIDSLPVYVGAVSSVVQMKANQRRFQHQANKHFYMWDLTDPIPRYAVFGELHRFDLLNMRDALHHMSNSSLLQAADNIRKSQISFIMASSYTPHDERIIDLQAAPFNFPSPMHCLADPRHARALLCVYDVRMRLAPPSSIQLHPPHCKGISKEGSSTFGRIYDKDLWVIGPRVVAAAGAAYYYMYGEASRFERSSRSGVGSNRGYQTRNSLLMLSWAINEYNVSSVLDIPCGDVNWQAYHQ